MRFSRASRAIAFSALLAATLSYANAQAPAAAPGEALHFDVISVRENKTGEGGMRWQTTASAYIGTNVTVMTVLMGAYGLRSDQISGAPGWVSSTRYDVEGKLVDANFKMRDLKKKQHEELLRSILIERFKLKAHIETRDAATYDLLVAKGGSKLKPVEPADPNHPEVFTGKGVPRGGFMFGNGMMQANALGISQLATQLANELERTVIDKTALTGVYDYKLTWAPDPDAPSTDSTAPNLFTALQEQLGLRLQPSRGQVETLVIDHIELPTSNEE